MKQPVQLFPCTLYVPSDIYGSRERAKYFFGRPDGPLSNAFKLSEAEAEQLIDNLPEELIGRVLENEKVLASIIEKLEKEEVITIGEAEVIIKPKGISDMTNRELREKAKELKIPGYSNMKTDELREAVKGLQNV